MQNEWSCLHEVPYEYTNLGRIKVIISEQLFNVSGLGIKIPKCKRLYYHSFKLYVAQAEVI